MGVREALFLSYLEVTAMDCMRTFGTRWLGRFVAEMGTFAGGTARRGGIPVRDSDSMADLLIYDQANNYFPQGIPSILTHPLNFCAIDSGI